MMISGSKCRPLNSAGPSFDVDDSVSDDLNPFATHPFKDLLKNPQATRTTLSRLFASHFFNAPEIYVALLP